MTHHYMYPRVTEIGRPAAVRNVRSPGRPRPRRSQRQLVEASLLRVPETRAA